MMDNIPLLLLLIVLLYINISHALTLPESFSLSHKKVDVADDSSNNYINTLLNKYELDTHIEIVILGDDINDSKEIKTIEFALDHLSSMSTLGSPLKHTHEKYIYHLSTPQGLKDSIFNIIENII